MATCPMRAVSVNLPSQTQSRKVPVKQRSQQAQFIPLQCLQPVRLQGDSIYCQQNSSH